MGEAKRKKAIAQAIGVDYIQYCHDERQRLFDNMVDGMVELIKLKVRQKHSLERCPDDTILRQAVIADLRRKGISPPEEKP